MDLKLTLENREIMASEESNKVEDTEVVNDDTEPNPEECTRLLNNISLEHEEKFTFIELKILNEERENSPVILPYATLERHENDIECRICRCKGDEPLISPCKCSGSSKWVHESCLVQWFQVSRTSKCELCFEKVIIKKYTKPISEWKRPKGIFGPCNKVDLWYFCVTLFSLCTIIGFAIFQSFTGPEEGTETTVIFIAIYVLCAIMILVRIRYFYLWFTRRSTFWSKWRSLNQKWNIKSVGSVHVDQEETSII